MGGGIVLEAWPYGIPLSTDWKFLLGSSMLCNFRVKLLRLQSLYKVFSTDLFQFINQAKAKLLFLSKKFCDHQSQVELRKSGPFCLSSVQFSHSVVSDSLWPHGLQQARPPCPSPTPGVYSNSYSLSQWWYPGPFPLSQYLHQLTKVLELQLQHQSFQWIFRIDFL